MFYDWKAAGTMIPCTFIKSALNIQDSAGAFSIVVEESLRGDS